MRPPHWALRLYASILATRARRTLASPRATQEALLMALVATYRDTELGRAAGLAAVKTPADFKRHVRVSEEADYQPIFERVLQTNAPGLVSPEPLQYIARTSGTTKASKLVPYPRRLIKAFKRFETRLAMHTMRELGNYTLLDGQALITSGNPTCDVLPNGLTVGFGSGIMTLLAPKMAKELVRPTRDILEIGQWERKIEATVEQAMPLDIRFMTGVPVFVVPILEKLLAHAEAQGRHAPHAKALWPNLAAYYWSGSPIGLYRDRLRELFGPGVMFREIYACTEAAIAFQYRAGEPGLLLDLEDTYYEFQPAGSALDAPRLGVHEVETGVPYRLLITTQGGLFAYRLGDLVEFLSTDPPSIRILGRESEELSLGFERMQLSAIREAIAAAEAAHGAKVGQFFIGPAAASPDEKQAYHWHVEWLTAPADPRAFLAAIDAHLVEHHPVYGGMRGGDSVLLPPRLTVLPPGTIERYILDTRQFGQGKFLHLYPTRDVPDAILSHPTP